MLVLRSLHIRESNEVMILKKFILMLLVLLFTVPMLMLVSCAQKSVLQTATGASGKELKAIEEHLHNHGIRYISIESSENPITEGMDSEYWEAFDLKDEDGFTYLLFLRKSDKSFEALLNEKNEVIEGLVDNASLPQFPMFQEQNMN